MRARQNEAPRRDPLTGLIHRQAFLEVLRAHAARGGAGALFMLDVDGFKMINDRYGHEAGDRIFQQVADRMAAWAPADAVLSRLGGDEFAILLPVASAAEASAACDAVLALCRRPIDLGGATLSASVSIGFTGCLGLMPNELLRRADIALYAAKARGRDQAVPYGVDVQTIPEARRQLAAIVVELQQQLLAVRQEARTDALTGVRNRRALDEAMGLIAERAAVPVGVAFIDLDHFGAINHSYGDAAGDETLRRVAAALTCAIRKEDLLFHKGGEEFVVVMTGLTHPAAMQAAARMLDAIRKVHVAGPVGDGGRYLTATIGVCTSQGEAAPWAVLENASATAMAAKEAQARNAVHEWQPVLAFERTPPDRPIVDRCTPPRPVPSSNAASAWWQTPSCRTNCGSWPATCSST